MSNQDAERDEIKDETHELQDDESDVEEEEEDFGANPWSHGLTAQNQVVLDKFVQYAHEQGYIPERPPLGELFAPLGT